MTSTAQTDQAITDAAVALNTAGCWLLSPATKRRIAAEAALTLPAGDYTLLTQIDRWQPVRLSTIAERLEVDRSSLSPQTQRLEGAGLIRRLPDPLDHRAQLVEVTEQGHAVLERLWAARSRALAELVADWAPEDVHRLTASLTNLATSIGSRVHREGAR
ncbi:MarR family winged helix-turn-helix transcriptional regulator [Candidatus Protofrankia californiensis]|uniref:MarR family winged helix-turn-helix transcriptional regulator n=1 Tax=Candidatus Protofrankia californiensis TaxID=1839754 RepID=UPI0010415BCA|nr:MarR family transcriptional regulator [Candidatus Protofrankia californiensis]